MLRLKARTIIATNHTSHDAPPAFKPTLPGILLALLLPGTEQQNIE